MTKKLAYVFALAAAVSLPVAAADDKAAAPAAEKSPGAAEKSTGAEGRAGSSIFTQLDADKDGFVSPTEAKKSAEVSANFKTLDADGDGKVSAQEMGGGQTK
jgi:hypothetical protein